MNFKRRDFLVLSAGGIIAGQFLQSKILIHKANALNTPVQEPPLKPQWIPTNLLPNTQWQVCTALPIATKYNIEGTGTLPLISVSDYSKGTNLVKFKTSNTTHLIKGEIVKFEDPTHPFVKLTGIRIENIIANKSFTGGLPLGLVLPSDIAVNQPAWARIIMPGDLVGITGDGADGWKKTVELWCWRDTHRENNQPGSRYQMGLKKTSDKEQSYYREIPLDDVDKYKGRQVVFGIWVKQKIKQGLGTWHLFINQYDAQGKLLSSSLSKRGNLREYQWREISTKVFVDAVNLLIGIELLGDRQDTYYLSQPMLAYGAYLGEGNYAQPNNEYLIPMVHFSPNDFINARIDFPIVPNSVGDYGFPMRLYAESMTAIAPTVKAISMQIEGRCDVLNRGFATRDQEKNPIILGVLVYAVASGQMMTGEGLITLKQGDFYISTQLPYTETPISNHWYNVSFDINGYLLS
jgi:hypothetical protein